MGSCRFVQPDTVRLPLSGGDWIDVIKELNAGEYYDLIVAMTEKRPFSKVIQYVLGWSLVGFDGKPVPYSVDLPETSRRETLRSLNTATIKELIAVIDRHESAEATASEAKKKAPIGETESSAILASVV